MASLKLISITKCEARVCRLTVDHLPASCCCSFFCLALLKCSPMMVMMAEPLQFALLAEMSNRVSSVAFHAGHPTAVHGNRTATVSALRKKTRSPCLSGHKCRQVQVPSTQMAPSKQTNKAPFSNADAPCLSRVTRVRFDLCRSLRCH